MRRVLIVAIVGSVAGSITLAGQVRGRGGPCCCGQGMLAGQMPSGKAPIAGNPVVNVTGKIAKVQIAPGQGMPFLEVQKDAETVKVFLGSMRYLMTQNFNPKAGQEVTVKGYKLTDGVVGIEVKLPAEGQTLRLRDENGWPLWRGGMRRGPNRQVQ